MDNENSGKDKLKVVYPEYGVVTTAAILAAVGVYLYVMYVFYLIGTNQ